MRVIHLSNRQARQFILLKQGLLGTYRFIEKKGVMEYISQGGCIQYDPIDTCGKNAELVLQSRVRGFSKKMLYDLLYEERVLIDYPDKNLSIISVTQWPYFERYREAARENAMKYEQIEILSDKIREKIKQYGALSSDDIKFSDHFNWQSNIHWSGGNNAARSVLEQMYTTGELVIHHKKGTRKYYDFSTNHIDSEILITEDPLKHDLEHLKWRVLRRIGAVGLLWNRASDAWLNIWNFKAEQRKEVFQQLISEKKIIPIYVEKFNEALYCLVEDIPLIEVIKRKQEWDERCELIAPLDNLMWDRKLIYKLFNFDYKWEIYTPESKRKYGYYILPILHGDKFIGRTEIRIEKETRTLIVKKIWFEQETNNTSEFQADLDGCLKRFSIFNDCNLIKHDYRKTK